jgi:hypothetical protein
MIGTRMSRTKSSLSSTKSKVSASVARLSKANNSEGDTIIPWSRQLLPKVHRDDGSDNDGSPFFLNSTDGSDDTNSINEAIEYINVSDNSTELGELTDYDEFPELDNDTLLQDLKEDDTILWWLWIGGGI